MKQLCGMLCFGLVLVTVSLSSASDQARRLVSLIDYIGADYRNAVQHGKVVNRAEYREMEEFSDRALEILAQLKSGAAGDPEGIEPSLKELAESIRRKRDEATVQELVKTVKEKLISTYGIIPYPKRLPSLAEGKAVYDQYCTQCHGPAGRGDGPSRATLQPKEPPPANFTDPEVMANLSPFRAFNTASFGVRGTAMADFSALPESERWQVAFYLHALRFSAEQATEGERLLRSREEGAKLAALAVLSTYSDGQLRDELKRYFDQDTPVDAALAYLRRGLLEKRSAEPLIVAATLLRQAVELYGNGETDKAYQKALEAYLDGFELAEPALMAKDRSASRRIEAQFAAFRAALKRGAAPEEVRGLYQEIAMALQDAERTLEDDHQWASYYLFLNSALIIFREGLEATLILAAILALLKVTGAQAQSRYIHLGWILALAAGVLTWASAQTILNLSGRHRETLEGFTTIVAALVLFYVGYWLHTKAEAEKWRKYIQDKVQGVVSHRSIWALVGVSFFAVYREAFEVILFYQALWLQSENERQPLIWGFFSGVLTLIVAAFAIFRLGLKIPLKYFFGGTGALLYLLAFVFAGQGVSELQAAGWFPVTPLSFPPPVSLLGLYPTLETLLAQGLMLGALLGSLFRLSRQNQTPE